MRYKRSVIGPFWISLTMASMVLGLGLMYSQVFGIDFREYLAWLGAGFLIWGFIGTGLTEACGTALEAESHLRSVNIPIPVLAARVVWRNAIVFLHNLLVICIVLIIAGKMVTPALIWLPAGLGVLMLLIFFASVFLGTLTLRFRDVTQIVANVIQVLFFLSPILWMPSQGRLSSAWVDYNPMYHLLEIVRGPLLGYQPSIQNWIWSLSIVGVLAIAAFAVSAGTRRKIYLWL